MTDAMTPAPAQAANAQSNTLSDPANWVNEHGDALFRYAMMRLPDQSAAEDAVQETFLAAVESMEKFQGQSQPRTWLIGILRHKIGDHFRKHRKELQVLESEEDASGMDSLFRPSGRWKQNPGHWKVNPQAIAQNKEFWQVLDLCMKGLGPRTREVFAMRVLNDCKSDEVCKVLAITSTNLWVHLHRARTQLRDCLEHKWFNPKTGSSSAEQH